MLAKPSPFLVALLKKQMKAERRGRFPNIIHARCPEALPPLIERAAQLQCMSPAEYVRRAIYERLKKDGVNLSALAVPAPSD